MAQEAQLLVHRGGCHCGGVRFEYLAPADQEAWDCNCSICNMKQNTHVFVQPSRFKLLKGEELLTSYRFNTKAANHLFCKVCGICPFYRPRSNPESYAITIYCVDPGTIGQLTFKKFNGVSWEEAYRTSGIATASRL